MATLPSIKTTYQVSKKIDARVLESGFGDGYSQRALDGLNSIVEGWSLTWTVNNTDSDTLTGFFEARGGHESFDWIPNGESVSKKWTCKSWTKSPIGYNVWTISATLKQRFDLI